VCASHCPLSCSSELRREREHTHNTTHLLCLSVRKRRKAFSLRARTRASRCSRDTPCSARSKPCSEITAAVCSISTGISETDLRPGRSGLLSELFLSNQTNRKETAAVSMQSRYETNIDNSCFLRNI